MCDPGRDYVSATWAAWLGRGIAVPLCLSHPDSEVEYVLKDSGASAIIASPGHRERMASLARGVGAELLLASEPSSVPPEPRDAEAALEAAADATDALIIYTSGTTGRPKGVVHTHEGLHAHTRSLCEAWGWRETDRILHTLPLHHIHGLGCGLLCALEAGATVEFMPRFSPTAVWDRLTADADEAITLFMGVPTMYSMLINTYNAMGAEREAARRAARSLRLWVSGSAACPPTVHAAWKDIAGQIPLERYGMTETGIVLSNPLHGDRRAGTVGQALPGLDIRLDGGSEGDIRVKGQQIFRCYWGRPEATAEAFDADGYFMTGDQAELVGEPPYISALDIEAKLLRHPGLKECAVVGLPDETYGEIIGAVIALREGAAPPTLQELRAWARDVLPPYQLPSELQVVEALPRNAMGKVNKKELRAACFPTWFAGAQP
ncbi:hypothetical protein QBZ16_004682 [Prototheca wickerhamii]|uniref:Uncharacterized protein n=1 Tax=Prototheca wickerhamii TaxID=3111 RepID=A0AAD9MH16_PROWI|nr:hypothetical protein QBZ16_004682 [Prototheca wickerhamii]